MNAQLSFPTAAQQVVENPVGISATDCDYLVLNLPPSPEEYDVFDEDGEKNGETEDVPTPSYDLVPFDAGATDLTLTGMLNQDVRFRAVLSVGGNANHFVTLAFGSYAINPNGVLMTVNNANYQVTADPSSEYDYACNGGRSLPVSCQTHISNNAVGTPGLHYLIVTWKTYTVSFPLNANGVAVRTPTQIGPQKTYLVGVWHYT